MYMNLSGETAFNCLIFYIRWKNATCSNYWDFTV